LPSRFLDIGEGTVARRPSKHRRTIFNVNAARIAVTSAWLAIVGLVRRDRRTSGQESDEALAEERRAHLFGTAHPHAASTK